MMNLYAIILAGGKGTRFWPKSLPERPKQLLPILSEQTMLEETISRVSPCIPPERVIVVTSQDLVPEVTPLVNPQTTVLAEPLGRNSAPAIAFATAYLLAVNPDAVMAVLPADHYIAQPKPFLSALQIAAATASRDNMLVTFGIPPTRPETGYGYIQVGETIDIQNGVTVAKADQFHEKPDLQTAHSFLRHGNFRWNSGMFVWSVATIAQAFEIYLPEMYALMRELSTAIHTKDEPAAILHFFQAVESISIDYGIMEKAQNVAVVSGDFHWDDVGSWASLERVYEKDAHGNVRHGDCHTLDVKRSVLYADQGQIAAIGISDLIVVRTDDITLVCPKDRAQDVKRLLENIEKESENEN
ncbi:MAG: mannose-1-phosphate guanylyltransferase [Gemmatimonadetes bacterium]|nr:MAG: mannose-1-phosphate guanylyltransferase [Gemmatimonadota bacterium]